MFAISLVCVLIGDLDIVSTLLSNFFVAAYALINFSVFHASITSSPGWRQPGEQTDTMYRPAVAA